MKFLVGFIIFYIIKIKSIEIIKSCRSDLKTIIYIDIPNPNVKTNEISFYRFIQNDKSYIRISPEHIKEIESIKYKFRKFKEDIKKVGDPIKVHEKDIDNIFNTYIRVVNNSILEMSYGNGDGLIYFTKGFAMKSMNNEIWIISRREDVLKSLTDDYLENSEILKIRETKIIENDFFTKVVDLWFYIIKGYSNIITDNIEVYVY